MSVVPSCNELLQRYWDSEEIRTVSQTHSSEEQAVHDYYKDNHLYTGGKYQVALPKKSGHQALGEFRQQAINRYYNNERSLHKHGNWDKFQSVVQEYFDLGHAEQVSDQDVSKVGPTIYPSLTDLLIHFHSFKIALSSDISKIYRAVELSPSDRDLHRFVWRRDLFTPLSDYRMTKITFGVAGSAFAAIRSLQQTALDFGDEFLSLEELKTAEVFLILSSQQRSFATEIKIIKAGIPLQVSNSLLTLHPVLIGGLLRVGGRLANAQLSAFQKNPRILHGKDVLTRLIVTSKHQELLHAGPTLMMANLNSKYHVIGAKRLTRTICKQCVVCRKAAERTGQ